MTERLSCMIQCIAHCQR